jgi:hypothetical protein
MKRVSTARRTVFRLQLRRLRNWSRIRVIPAENRPYAGRSGQRQEPTGRLQEAVCRGKYGGLRVKVFSGKEMKVRINGVPRRERRRDGLGRAGGKRQRTIETGGQEGIMIETVFRNGIYEVIREM